MFNWSYLDNNLTTFQQFFFNVLRCGQVPKTVAFIADGNRTFAKSKGIEYSQAYHLGVHKLFEAVGWCRIIGVSEVTCFIFSIANFNRSRQEVSFLMKLFDIIINQSLAEDPFAKRNLKLKLLGNKSYLSDSIVKGLEILEAQTVYKEVVMNIAMAYTSSDELTCAIKEIVERAQSGSFDVELIDESLFEKSLQTSRPSMDLLIRTSDQKRLSDFLQWQCAESMNFFYKINWPELSVWHFIHAVFVYGMRKNCKIKNSMWNWIFIFAAIVFLYITWLK